MSIPSVRAVLALIVKSETRGVFNRQIARFLALQNTADIGRNALEARSCSSGVLNCT
jgi:hypothetical protein